MVTALALAHRMDHEDNMEPAPKRKSRITLICVICRKTNKERGQRGCLFLASLLHSFLTVFLSGPV